jgi:hypothetical protein
MAVAGSSAYQMHQASLEVPSPYWPACLYSTVDVAPDSAIMVHPTADLLRRQHASTDGRKRTASSTRLTIVSE